MERKSIGGYRHFLAVLSIAVGACGGGGGDDNAAPPAAVFLYALQTVNAAANQLHGFSVNTATGALTLLAGFPMATGGNGDTSTFSEHVAYDAANHRLYAINGGSSTVSAFSINGATGALTALPFSPISVGAAGACIAVHPSGSPLVVATGAAVASFNITATTATPAAGSPFSTGGASPFSCAFSRDGGFVYTGGNSGATFAGFSVNATNGVLTALAGSPFASGANNPVAFATDSTGRLFSTNATVGQVRAFTTLAGVPAAVTGNPFTSGLALGIHGVLHAAGFYMVADRSANQVGVYQIAFSGAATTLTAVAGSPFAAGGTFTDALALNPAGTYLYAANGTSRNITIYTVNATTGVLSNPLTQPANTLGATGNISGIVRTP